MTETLLGGKEKGGAKVCTEIKSLKFKKESKQNEFMLSFQKQQESNLQVKEALAKELAAMEVPESIAHKILNI